MLIKYYYFCRKNIDTAFITIYTQFNKLILCDGDKEIHAETQFWVHSVVNLFFFRIQHEKTEIKST